MRALRKRKPQTTQAFDWLFDDWLFRSTIPIGWRLRALRLDLRNVFDCVIFLRLLRFLRTFRFPAKRNRLRCVRCMLCVKLETGLYIVN